jgi:hypothetical protein
VTEQEWLACADPTPMLTFLQGEIIALVDDLPSEAERQAMRRLLQGKTIPRKLALFACACCRQIWQVVTDARSRNAVEVAEQAIDGLMSEDQLQVATLASHDARNAIEHKWGKDRAETHIRRVAANACWEGASAVWCARGFGSSVARAVQESADVAAWIGLSASFIDARAKQAQFLRCIVGNPFKPATADSRWLSWNGGIAVKLAHGIYDKRDFARLPVLGDALQEAGCDNKDILEHCRQAEEHVRGCWVVDLILGRE